MWTWFAKHEEEVTLMEGASATCGGVGDVGVVCGSVGDVGLAYGGLQGVGVT